MDRGWVASMREVVRVTDVVSAAIASVEGVVQPISVVAVCFAEEVMLTGYGGVKPFAVR